MNMRAAWERLAQLDRKRSEELETIRAAYDAVVVELEEAQAMIDSLTNDLWVRLYNEAINSGAKNADAKAYADKLGKGEL